MKCIYCDKEADYLLRGNSYCKECLLKFHSENYPWSISGFDTEKSIRQYREELK